MLLAPHRLGKVLSLTGGITGPVSVVGADGTTHRAHVAATVDEACATGFRHPNCRCHLLPYIDGMDLGQLAVPRAAAAATYAASQKQRHLERRVRLAGRAAAVAVTPSARRRAHGDLAAARAASAAHRRRTGLRQTQTGAQRREHPFNAH